MDIGQSSPTNGKNESWTNQYATNGKTDHQTEYTANTKSIIFPLSVFVQTETTKDEEERKGEDRNGGAGGVE